MRGLGGTKRFARAAVVIAASVFVLHPVPDHAAPAVAPDLVIRSATIIEQPPLDPTDVPGRHVSLKLVLSGAPNCATSANTYGFLVDADNDQTTGAHLVAVPELGVEAKLVAACDIGSHALFSPLGSVSLRRNRRTGIATILISTTVGQLPSIKFSWVAFADDGTTFTRLPASGAGAWEVTELRGE